MMNEKLNERFCRDLNLPIKIFSEPYFRERLLLYDNYFDCVDKYKQFMELVGEFKGEQEYLKYYNEVKDNAISYLRSNPNMIHFSQEEDMNKFRTTHTGLPKKDIYHSENIGKMFVSFDMKKGNFTALHHYDKRIVGNKDTYEDFIGTFTDKEHIINSKYIRQVIFGNINPKRQITYEQFLMDKVLDDVIKVFGEKSICFFSTDEIVAEIDKKSYEEKIKDINNIVKTNCEKGINIRSTVFNLHKVNGIDGFIKENVIGEKPYEIKCVDSLYMPFLLRKLNNEPVQKNDFVFLHNGILAKLLEEPKIQIPEFKRTNQEKVIDTEDILR